MLTLYVFHVFFFVKQKTAYEMRISDWSSDVCSSELQRANDVARDILLQRSGGLRVVASPSVGHYVIPNTIKALTDRIDRKSVVSGKRVSVRVDLGGGRIIKKKQTKRLRHTTKCYSSKTAYKKQHIRRKHTNTQ